jgi:hypothetical protein
MPWIHMENKAKDGKTEEWMVEGGTPNTLQRNGITRESIKVGTIIVESATRRRTGACAPTGATLRSGRRTLFMGSSGTGAPRDGKDPNEKPKPKGQ